MKKIYFYYALAILLLGLTVSNLVNAQPNTPWPATLSIPKPEPDTCIKKIKAGSFDLKCDGLLFVLHVPSICLKKACGLIVDVHGWQMSGDLQDYYTNISKLGGDAGYIVVNPTANRTLYGRSWSYLGDNDSQIFSIMERVKKVFHVMEERVHITGFSQGAGMTWRFVCKYPHYIASAAPIGFGAGDPINFEEPVRIRKFQNCFNQQIDILYAHGKNDGIVDYSGALITVKQIGKEWNMNKAKVISKDDNHQRVSFSNPEGTIFEFISYDWETAFPVSLNARVASGSQLKGHCFPGASNFLGCGKDNAFHWGEEVVKFFLAHPKKN